MGYDFQTHFINQDRPFFIFEYIYICIYEVKTQCNLSQYTPQQMNNIGSKTPLFVLFVVFSSSKNIVTAVEVP